MNREGTSFIPFRLIALLSTILLFQVSPSLGGPGSVLNATDPLPSAPALETRDLAVGDMTVASRTGAFEYSYPIPVPPGRLGNKPSLALSYSSQGALRGGIAAGWSLSIPEVKLEFPEGRSKGGVYVSSMSGGHRLVRTNEVVAHMNAGLDAAYRAEYDDSYIRYSINRGVGEVKVVAMTPDGMTYRFGEKNNLDQFGLPDLDATRWPLTSTVDKFGNRVEYEYFAILPTSDDRRKVEEYVLSQIKYGRNDSAELGHHATIRFDYSSPDPCQGTGLTAGASLNHRWEHMRTRGARKLVGIKTFVTDTPGGSRRPVRTIELGYDSEAERCDVQHGPLRMLTSITEHAPALAGDPNPGTLSSSPENWVSRPPVTFSYGPLTRSWNKSDDTTTTGLESLGKGSRPFADTGIISATKWPSLDKMLLDFNGDGIVDRISAVQPTPDSGQKCRMNVRLGNGGPSSTAGTVYDLPTLPWQHGDPSLNPNEGCSLLGQFTFHETRQLRKQCGNIGSYLAYRFMDMNADGLPDLVTEISSDPVHFMNWDPDSGVDDTDLPPYNPDAPGSCPLVAPELVASAEVCRQRDNCVFDQDAVKEMVDTSKQVACGYLLKDNHADPKRGPIPKVADFLDDDFGLPTPTSEDEPECGRVRTRLPQIHNGRYVWRWYENVNGVLSTQRQLTMSPIPLTANAGEGGFGNGPLSNSSGHGVYDITGDGFIDAISKDANHELRAAVGDDPYNIKFNPLVWWVWPGDGNGGFDTAHTPIAWKIPGLTNLSRGENRPFPGQSQPGEPEYFVAGRTTVKDVNADGLIDLLKVMEEEATGVKRVYVFLNTGEGFRSEAFSDWETFNGDNQFPDIPPPHIAWPYRTSGGGAEIDATSFDIIFDDGFPPGDSDFVPNARRYSRLMMADIDGDGLPDIHSQGTKREEGINHVFYGAADGRLLAPRFKGRTDVPVRQIRGERTVWRLVSDYVDFNGDGVMDQIVETGGFSGTYLTDDFHGQPMRLMVSVDNGNGLTTDIRYAPNNAQDVAIDPDNIKGMPHHVWVVKSVKRSESFGPKVVPSPDNIVEVKYGAPVWNEDTHGHWGFRGFETIQTSAAHKIDAIKGFSVTEQKYDFTLDWSGRQNETVLYVRGFPVGDGSDAVASISKSTWIERAVTNGLSLSYVINRETTRDCATVDGGFESESTCATNPMTNEKRIWHKYYRHHLDSNGPDLMSSAFRSWKTPTGSFTSDTKDGAIVQETINKLFSDESQYHLMTTSEITYRGNGTTLEKIAKTEQDPDASGRYFTNERIYLGDTSQETLLTNFERDETTGHLTSRQKPKQAAQSPSGPKEIYEFSGFKVVPTLVKNELQHETTSETDLGTGQNIVTHTPNTIMCADDSSGPAGTQSKYDGFGRPVELFEYGCHNNTYTPIRVKRFEYIDYDQTNPASVLTHSLIAYAGAEAESESYFDGYGRLIRARSLIDNGNANSFYEYGVNGKVRRHRMPNPSKNNDMAKTEFTYRYDSLGRQIGMRVANQSGVAPEPDSDVATWDNAIGVDISYARDGSETITTRTEHVLDGSAASKTTTYHNNFEQLTRVDELTGDGTSIAKTTYGFDGNGNLSNIQDSGGFLTTMEHDWASRRTKIVRGAREWTFEYDLNNNLKLKMAPVPVGANPASYQTSYKYDALDRVRGVKSAPRDLSEEEQKLVGAKIPTIYTYDEGFNGIGRVSSVKGSIYKRTYTYDFAGRVASEKFGYNVTAATGFSTKLEQGRSRSFQYNAAGSPTHVTTADGMQLRYEYDSAGRQIRLWWDNSSIGSVNVAEFTRNVAGNVIFQQSGCVARKWGYDQLGRVKGTQVRKIANTNCVTSGGGGGASGVRIAESMSYYDSNEVKTLTIDRFGLESRVFTFSYDPQHQLIAASDNIDEYDANFSFTEAGRIKDVSMASINGAPLVIGRNVTYDYGDHDTVDGHAVEFLNNTSDGSLNTAYVYDLSGNVGKRHEAAQNSTWSFRYDGNDRQRIVTGPDGNDEIYYYDENGQRYLSVERNSEGKVLGSRFWFGDSEFWFDAPGQAEKKMTNLTLGATPVARVDNENEQKNLEYSFHNGLGHMMGAVDSSGDLTTAYVYGPFGEIVEESGETDTHLRRFNGKEADQLSRLNYYGYRYYDPLSLMWTQSDPLYRVAPDLAYDQPRLISLYAFSLNNPVRYADPDGRQPVIILTEGVKLNRRQLNSVKHGLKIMNQLVTGRQEKIRIVRNSTSNAYHTVDFKGKDIAVVVVDSTSGGQKAVNKRVANVYRSAGSSKKRARRAARRSPLGGSSKKTGGTIGGLGREDGVAIVGTEAAASPTGDGTTVTAHEVGHSLGLDHDNKREGNLMHESGDQGKSESNLEEDQIEKMKKNFKDRLR